jgi:putative DNA primase/helicase
MVRLNGRKPVDAGASNRLLKYASTAKRRDFNASMNRGLVQSSYDLRAIARALGGVVVGRQVLAPGPGHSPKDRSLSITLSVGAPDGFLAFSHAGDDFAACRDFVKAKLGVDGDRWREDRGGCRKAALLPSCAESDRAVAALRIWADTHELRGSVAEAYLASRGIIASSSTALRFHPSLKHPCGSRWPALVALITRGVDGESIAIHRTFVTCHGKAPVDPAKMMLGPTRGGAVRLAEASDKLMIGEGIESCLSVMQVTGIPTWAALSTSGLKTLALPEGVRDVVILADGDDAGERAAMQAARRWKGEGRRVRIARPPRGEDFNDVARRNVLSKEVA